MAKKKEYQIGDEFFPSQEVLLAHCQEIIYGEPLNQPLAKNHANFLGALLQLHKNSEKKIGCGIQHFEIRKTGYKPPHNLCFWIVRIDGSETDFSFMKCLRNPSARNEFNAACRSAIWESKTAYREQYIAKNLCSDGKTVPSEMTGAAVAIDDIHVDHKEPLFDSIVSDFLKSNSIDLCAVEFIHDDGETFAGFKDQDLAMRFKEFHDRVAKLRVVGKSENLTRKKKE